MPRVVKSLFFFLAALGLIGCVDMIMGNGLSPGTTPQEVLSESTALQLPPVRKNFYGAVSEVPPL